MTTQRNKVLQLLRNAGQSGVSSYEFTFTHHIKQAPTRIHELKKMGFNIISKPKDNTVIYVLLEASQVTTQPVIQPENPWEKDYEPYIGKDGRTYYREKQVATV